MLKRAKPFVGLCMGHGTNKTGTSSLLSPCNLTAVKGNTVWPVPFWVCGKVSCGSSPGHLHITHGYQSTHSTYIVFHKEFSSR